MNGRLVALTIGVVASLALAEGVARVLEPPGPVENLAGDIGERIPDPVLEYRTAPSTGDNDARGYRNETALEQADIVALGDSQTWGVNASRDATWPAALGAASGKSVYNMGRGGYGVVQYRHQLEGALALKPQWVVVALYFGNDVYDAYALAYSKDAHTALRHPDAATREKIVGSEYPDLRRMLFDRLAYGRRTSGVLGQLEEHSALLRMIARATRSAANPEADRRWAADHPQEGFSYDGPVPTVFHTAYRVAAVDTSLPKVAEGLRITRDVLRDIARRVDDLPDTRLMVVLIPTKERIFARAVSTAGVPAPFDYVRSVSHETRIALGLQELLREEGVLHVDTLPAFEAALERGEAIFPPNVDGHLTEAGYQVIAERVAAALAEAGQR